MILADELRISAVSIKDKSGDTCEGYEVFHKGRKVAIMQMSNGHFTASISEGSVPLYYAHLPECHNTFLSEYTRRWHISMAKIRIVNTLNQAKKFS